MRESQVRTTERAGDLRGGGGTSEVAGGKLQVATVLARLSGPNKRVPRAALGPKRPLRVTSSTTHSLKVKRVKPMMLSYVERRSRTQVQYKYDWLQQ